MSIYDVSPFFIEGNSVKRMARIVYILALPFGFLWRHKKLAIVLIVAGFGFLIYQQQFKPETPNIPEYSENIPKQIQNLPVIQTTTSYYYVQYLTEDDKTVYLNDFYAYDKEWTRYNSIPVSYTHLTLPTILLV